MDEDDLQAILGGIAEQTDYRGPWHIMMHDDPSAPWSIFVVAADTRLAILEAWNLALTSPVGATIRVKEPEGDYVAQVFAGQYTLTEVPAPHPEAPAKQKAYGGIR